MPIRLDTRLVPIPGIPHLVPLSPLGLLAPLVGTWHGQGFNQIFRPMEPALGSDNFLELNLTSETLEFTEIPGEIPNRGLVQGDISLFGMTYLQQVSDVNVKDTNGNPAGIHIEPGIWLNIPLTTNPAEQSTVARLANIPHGTALVAQGTARVVAGPPVIPNVDITPFFIGQPANKVPFPSQNLAAASPFRSPPSDIVGITQGMVDNPNSVLQAALLGKTINSHTLIQISTISSAATVPNAGGGVSDIAFLDGTGGNPNARVFQMDATFWISDYTDASGSGTLMQYSQLVLLNFAPLSWPHVSVNSLLKEKTKSVLKDIKDSKIEIKEHKEIKEKDFKEKELKELKPEIKELKPEIKEHKLELREGKLEIAEGKLGIKDLAEGLGQGLVQPDPGRAGPAAAAPAAGRHFILPAERPAVGEPPKKEPPKKS
jgi:hypothetical protein